MLYRIGLIGCGSIGTQLAVALDRGDLPGARLISITDQDPAASTRLQSRLSRPVWVRTLTRAAMASDILVEAAGGAAVPEIARAALTERKDLIVMSVGALIAHPRLREQFHRKKIHLHFPSGAVTGLDALKAAVLGGGVRRVRLITRKPVSGLIGAPYLKKKKINLAALTQPYKIFSGSARQAIASFPENVNVAAAVSLVGIGPDKTRVEVIADPQARRNRHTLEVEGHFGRFVTQTENVPSPENPKTSRLAALSAMALIRGLVTGDRSGT